MTTKKYEIVWGIDVSKEWLDISIEGKVCQIDQTEKSINAFILNNRRNEKNTLAVLESTGGYEVLAANCLAKAGLMVHIAHPNKVRHYAKAKGRYAKTDKLDAKIIEGYGHFMDEKRIRELPSKIERRLKELSGHLAELKQTHHQAHCRLGLVTTAEVKRSHKRLIKLLEKQIKQIEARWLALIKADEGLYQKYTLLRSMKSVGPTLAMTLIAELPELGKANKKEIAALVGVAPMVKESGKYAGKAMVQQGRHQVRKISNSR